MAAPTLCPARRCVKSENGPNGNDGDFRFRLDAVVSATALPTLATDDLEEYGERVGARPLTSALAVADAGNGTALGDRALGVFAA
jgi:hypothetical protein